MKSRIDRLSIVLLLVLCSAIFIFLAVKSEGAYQGGDTYQHYLIARYAASHPHLFLDHWGKPVFTTLYSLPSMSGYTAAKMATVCFGILTALFTFLTAKKLRLSYAWCAVILTLFSPMFFIHMNTVMTEVLFSTWLMAGLYLLLSQRWIFGAIFLSLLPFVRTEGFVLLPLICVYMIVNRKWKAFFLLGSGTLVYSFIGTIFHYHDFFWIFSQNPYRVVSPYGHGTFLHFATSNKVIWGIPFSIALAASFFALAKRAIKEGRAFFSSPLLLLVIIPFFVFFLFHSIAWATGTLASNGELRVMVCTMPLAAIMVIVLFTELRFYLRSTFILHAIVLLFAVVVIITPFQLFKMPLARNVSQQVIHEAGVFIKENFPDRRVHFVDPQLVAELGLDPFDPQQAVQWFVNPETPEVQMAPGDIVVWDAHFAAHEGRTPIASFQRENIFELKREIRPEKPKIIFDKEEYFVAVFEYIRK